MLRKDNILRGSHPWQSNPYHVAARFRQLLLDDDGRTLQIQYVEIETGGRVLPHVRKHGEVYYCIEGTGLFTVEDETTAVEEGDCLFVPSGSIRGIVNSGEVPLRFLVIDEHVGQPSNHFSIGRLLSLVTKNKGAR